MFTRGSGILMHISSLPSVHGIGDMGPAAFAFADMLYSAKQTYWQVLPLNPTQPSSFHSPYFSASALAGNPLLISLEKVVESGLLLKSEIPTTKLPENVTDYAAVTRFKIPLLEKAALRFFEKKEHVAYNLFCDTQAAWLDDYALFVAACKKYGGETWNRWPDKIKNRDPLALQELAVNQEKSIYAEKWYQFIFFEQWNELKRYSNQHGIAIIGDIPIYVSYESVDVWVCPEIFNLDENLLPITVSGVPPDYFSATGQLWNNPVYNWVALKASGFDWWISRMQAMFTRFDIVRIDHFRGLVQYWEVPAGEKTAINGAWRDVPTYEFFDKLIKKVGTFSVIAEDLGIITDDVRAAMDHYTFPGMRVFLFAFGDDNPEHPYLPHMYPENAFAYTGTHDNNTIRGWYEDEASPEEKQRLLRYTGITAVNDNVTMEAIAWKLIRLAEGSSAACVILPVQDLLVLGSYSRMNRPAVAGGNWRWRLTPSQMKKLPVKHLATLTEEFGRSHELTTFQKPVTRK